MGYSECKGLDALHKVTIIMQRDLHWTGEEAKRQSSVYSAWIAERDKALSLQK